MTATIRRRPRKPLKKRAKKPLPPDGVTWWAWKMSAGTRCMAFWDGGLAVHYWLRRERRGRTVTFSAHTAAGRALPAVQLSGHYCEVVSLLLGERKRSTFSYMRNNIVRVPYCGYKGPVPTAPPSLWVSEGL